MPSDREIAEWLREAARTGEFYSWETRKLFLERAQAVESMRCETCRWWGAYIMPPAGCCTKKMCPMYKTDCGADFYCCHWEGKE